MEDNFILENENKTDKTSPEMMPTKTSDQVRNVAIYHNKFNHLFNKIQV